MSAYYPEPFFYPDTSDFTCGKQYKCVELKCDPCLGNSLSPAMSKLHFNQDDGHQESGRQNLLEGGGKNQLPQDLLDMVDSLLQDEPFSLQEDPATNLLDLELAAVSPWLDTEDLDPLNVKAMMGNDVGSRSGEVLPGPRSPRTKRARFKTKRRQRCSDATLGLPTIDVQLPQYPPLEDHLPQYPPLEDHLPQYPPLEDHLPQYPPLEDHLPQYPPLEDHLPQYPPLEDHLPQYPPLEDHLPQYPPLEDHLSQHSPSEDNLSQHSPLEDQLSQHPPLDMASSDTTTRPRRRRPRVSYSTLTEEEKYHRIRELNNEASKGYRQRRRQELSRLEQQEQQLHQKNAVLQTKVNGLLELKDRVKDYYHNFLNQHYVQS